MKKLFLLIAVIGSTSVGFAEETCSLKILMSGERKALHDYPDITNVKVGGEELRSHSNQLLGYRLQYTYTYKGHQTMIGYVNYNENCNGMDGSSVKAE